MQNEISFPECEVQRDRNFCLFARSARGCLNSDPVCRYDAEAELPLSVYEAWFHPRHREQEKINSKTDFTNLRKQYLSLTF